LQSDYLQELKVPFTPPEQWEQQVDQPDFGFLQIDAKNAFNELD
jgi:hypothetical protein